jgi:hypothetical protein
MTGKDIDVTLDPLQRVVGEVGAGSRRSSSVAITGRDS